MVLALLLFLAFLLLHPLGLQAVLAGREKDVQVTPSELTVFVSNASVFCYSDTLELKNLGVAGLTYALNFSLEGSAAVFELRSRSLTIPLAPAVAVKQLRLEPGASAKLGVCVKGPASAPLKLHVWDPRYPEATEQVVSVKVVYTDWWNNTFSRRVELEPVVSKDGLALFEVTGAGEVYVNGRYVRRVRSLAGLPAGSVAVVYRVGGADYLLPSQVEAWFKHRDGFLEPRGLKAPGEAIGADDRLVFAAYLTNGSGIHLYLGGGPLSQPEPKVEVLGSRVVVDGFSVDLNDFGFSSSGFSANLSGSIAYPFWRRREDYSDPGRWRLVLSGPVRTIFAFNTSGIWQYRVEAFLTVWGRGANSTLAYVWPSVEYRGIILEWLGPLVSYANATFMFECGTTCEVLPVKLEPMNETATRIVLCRDYWQPGARYGYYVLLFSKLELAELKSLGVKLSSFPGG